MKILLVSILLMMSSTMAQAADPQGLPAPGPHQLLDDASLRIAQANIPAVPATWRDDVLARRHPIRSLSSDDFSDLQFLKPLLAGKRIVQLGETSHGVAESNWAKLRLVKFLHQEMGFDVLAFESSFDQCYEADKGIGALASHDLMGRCLFSIWHTREVSSLFDYLAQARKSARPLSLAGFDIQFSGYHADKSRRHSMLRMVDSALPARFENHEKELGAGKTLTAQRSAEIQAFYKDVAARLQAARAQLGAAGYSRADIDAEIQTARARVWLARRNEHLDVPMSIPGNEIRDAGMAEQLNFLLDSLYPRRKLIVWAHNMHITHAHAPGDFVSMGEVLAQQRRQEMYTVAFYVGRGMVGNGQAATWPVASPPPETVEGVLANGTLKYAFVDFSKAGSAPSTSWFTGKNTVREFGTVPKAIVPAQSYDAIFYIDSVTPAEKY
jgi:erythromycin esterase